MRLLIRLLEQFLEIVLVLRQFFHDLLLLVVHAKLGFLNPQDLLRLGVDLVVESLLNLLERSGHARLDLGQELLLNLSQHVSRDVKNLALDKLEFVMALICDHLDHPSLLVLPLFQRSNSVVKFPGGCFQLPFENFLNFRSQLLVADAHHRRVLLYALAL